MDLKPTIDIILRDLEEVVAILEDIRVYPGVPKISIELAKTRCRSVEEIVKLLDDPSLFSNSEKNDGDDNRNEEEETHHEHIEETRENTEKDTFTLLDEIIQPGEEEAQTENKQETAKKIIADNFLGPSSLNEKAAGRVHDTDQKEAARMRPLGNITMAIGINDRFLFVRELFDGNGDLYTQTISRLNNTTSVEEAYNILTSSTDKKADREVFNQLLDLVRRKLSSD